MMEPNPERLPEQRPLVLFDVDAMSSQALGFASWQFNQYKTYFWDYATDASDFETARKYMDASDVFERQMNELAQRDPNKVATAYEWLLEHPTEHCRAHAVDCIEAYAQVRPDKVRSFIECLMNDREADIRSHARFRLELQLKGDQVYAEDGVRRFGLSLLEATQLLIEAYNAERQHAKDQTRIIGSLSISQGIERSEE